MELEKRITQAGCELRAKSEEDGGAVIEGYAAVFNSLSEDLGGWFERIQPGSFKDALGDDVRALFNHDPNLILGRSTSGTLELEEDSKGLKYKIKMPKTRTAADLVESINRGDVSQSSFAFMVRAGGQNWVEEDGKLVRVLTSVRLYDVSPVTYPAYLGTDTSVAKRSLADWKKADQREMQSGLDIDILKKRLDLRAKTHRKG